ncbi:MAG: ABC transporter permease, partial [Streptomyces sp.]|nr:ABC transporter permease [Streptomyces sp.]
MSDMPHGTPPAPQRRWDRFRGSPFLPATVLALIVSAAAGLFAWSYTYAMADPTPRSIPM